MSQILGDDGQEEMGVLTKCSSMSGLLGRNNKERMKEFKALNLKRNSVMDHLLSCRTDKTAEHQTFTLFHSQKWALAPNSSKNEEKHIAGSCKLTTEQENPFFRAKQNYLKKQKATTISESSLKSIVQPQVELQQLNVRTTFRKLTKGSVREAVSGTYRMTL